MTISMLYFDTPKFSEDTLENIYVEGRKLNAFMCSEAVPTETLKDNALRGKILRFRIHLPRTKATIFSPHCVLHRQGGKCPKS